MVSEKDDGIHCSCWPLHKISSKTLVRVTAAIVNGRKLQTTVITTVINVFKKI